MLSWYHLPYSVVVWVKNPLGFVGMFLQQNSPLSQMGRIASCRLASESTVRISWKPFTRNSQTLLSSSTLSDGANPKHIAIHAQIRHPSIFRALVEEALRPVMELFLQAQRQVHHHHGCCYKWSRISSNKPTNHWSPPKHWLGPIFSTCRLSLFRPIPFLPMVGGSLSQLYSLPHTTTTMSTSDSDSVHHDGEEVHGGDNE